MSVLLAVNGTLMRGLNLNHNMRSVGGLYVRDDLTDPDYRLWSINDAHPGMIRSAIGGQTQALEIWRVPAAGIAALLASEPAGLCIGKIRLVNGGEVLGVLAEPWLVEGQKEITDTGGWRQYTGHFHTD